MHFVGIDPGKHGGYVRINEKREILFFDIMRDLAWLRRTLKLHPVEDTMVFLEKAQAFPGDGPVGAFSYGSHFGEICGMLYGLGVSHELVPPVTWTKAMHVGTTGDRPKMKSLQAVQRLFPTADLKNPDSPRARIMHDGLVDALLIAEYGRRKMVKGETIVNDCKEM